MNGYDLSRNFWEWCFNNPEKIKPIHSAIFFFALEHCNRLGWKDKFGFPSQMVMEAIGVKNWRTYSSGLKDLVDFGFIEMIETSKNQYSSNIIAIVNFTKAHTKALDKALQKHSTKHSQSTVQSTVSINKQETKNKEQQTKAIDFKTLLIENKDSHMQWTETLYMKHGLKNGSLGKLLEEYDLSIKGYERKHQDLKDYKRNFVNWLNKMDGMQKLNDYKR